MAFIGRRRAATTAHRSVFSFSAWLSFYMNAAFPWAGSRSWWIVLLSTALLPICGCTSALWDKKTFAHYYRPTAPANLHLYYSQQRKDILVQYDESEAGDTNCRPRCYWLEPNAERIGHQSKPHFVGGRMTGGLTPIPVIEAVAPPAQGGFKQLYAVAGRDDEFFTLYCGAERLDPYQLPQYIGSSQKITQVLLTPFTLVIDATIVGAVIGYYSAPQIFASWNR